ncbi:MAG: N-acetylglucosamine-6-phosphate deacetylase [Acidobacteriota bacterium]|nr:N-acetylglucosamine-6-phosphate deacetylase [Acidobacteriota bacterium]
MKKLLLQNASAVLPDGKAKTVAILIEDGKIADISFDNKLTQADEVFDLPNTTFFVGFIDIHNHGAVGVDVNSASAKDLREVSKFLAGKGVTAWLPTLVPDSDENYGKIIKSIDELMETQMGEPIAQILGVHYEGVFANEKMCGALRPEFFKTFKRGDEVKSLPRLKKGIHLTTLAPEVENGIELVRELKKQNWIVLIGHTKADLEILEKAFEAGAKHLTHFFNAMTGLHHRDVGVVGWALTKKETTFDIIADGVHVHPQMLKFGIESKGANRVSLISDSVAPTGLGDGDYKLWNEKISVVNGKTQNERGSIAGSVITMLDAVKMMRELGFSEWEVSRMASANPARLLGIEKNYGSIEIGKRADLVAVDEQGNVKLTLINGKIFTEARA